MQFFKSIFSFVLFVLIMVESSMADTPLPGRFVQQVGTYSIRLQVLTDKALVECELPDCSEVVVLDQYEDFPVGVGYLCGAPFQLLKEDRIRPKNENFDFSEPTMLFSCADRFSLSLSEKGGQVWHDGEVSDLIVEGEAITSPYSFEIVDFEESQFALVGLIDQTILVLDYRDEANVIVKHISSPFVLNQTNGLVGRLQDDRDPVIYFQSGRDWHSYNLASLETFICKGGSDLFAANGQSIEMTSENEFSISTQPNLCSDRPSVDQYATTISRTEYHKYWSSYLIENGGRQIEVCYFGDRLCESYNLSPAIAPDTKVVPVASTGEQVTLLATQNEKIFLLHTQRSLEQ
ncbi:MAG: hypothetical protein ACRBCL_08215 [Maritimibacter sp.]